MAMAQRLNLASVPILISHCVIASQKRLQSTRVTWVKDADALDAGFNTRVVYPSHAVPNVFLTNHDVVRFGDLLQRGQLAEPSDSSYWDRHKAAYAFMAASSGPLTFFYGERD